EEICDDIALINRSENVLSGKVSEIRDNFSKREYDITFKGNMVAFANSFWGGFELIGRKQLDKDTFTANVRLMDHVKLNEFLSGIIPNCEVQSVIPIVPTMNDIFIDVVGNDNGENAAQNNESLAKKNQGGEDE
ncbi:MAG: DUF4162 domain-containing protein, partial [Flavobacteriales bacterium]|nr:DUF4162 domain-containing protein [Flavobacteriales bacterium]